MKKYVIILSKTFPATHARAGEPTNFTASLNKAIMCERCRQKLKGMCVGECIIGQKKLHTIRGNYDLWEKRFKEIEEGNACLSVREWAGVPYRSKQVEIVRLTAKDGIGLQKIYINGGDFIVNGKHVSNLLLPENDGLLLVDWTDWFKAVDNTSMAIIHFTKFRY